MATEQEKEELIDVLKFTPRTYKIRMYGYGGEVVIGKINPKIFDYFKNNHIDVTDFANGNVNECEIPKDLLPFEPNAWYECDNIVHESGVEMADSCTVEVEDETGTICWSSNLDIANLEELECDMISGDEIYISDEPEGTVVFYGQQFEKGNFFEGSFELTSPFDFKKLSFTYEDIEGWTLCSQVDYNGEEIENDDGGDTTGKSSHFAFVRVLADEETETYDEPNEYEYEYEDEE